ncbi:MAG: ABC transporter permease [Romboutsia sp.]
MQDNIALKEPGKDNKNKMEYLKKETERKLKSFKEYTALRFSMGISTAILVILLIVGIDFKDGGVSIPTMVFAGLYLISVVAQLATIKKVKGDILEHDEIQDKTRKIGYALIPFLVIANIFSATAGMTLVKKDRGIEYTLSIYMILISFSSIMISAINLFKPYVANTYYIGMGILIAITLFYIYSIIMISKHIKEKKVDKCLKPIAIILMATVVIGNLFAFAAGLVILRKLKHKDAEISIEWIDVLRRLFRNDMTVLGLFVIVLLMSISLCSYLTFDYAIAIENNYSTILLAPSLQFPLGTDDFGRCVFSRIVFGARISLSVGLVSTLIPIFVGGGLGAISGYYGKVIDNSIMRILDVLYAVPGILLAIAIVAAFGASTFNLILALSIGSIPGYARTVRATVMRISNNEFVEAAKACGAKDTTIILKHIMPNSLAPIIVQATLGIGGAVLSTSSLSYLGLGVEPHIPEWGNILKIGSKFLETNPHLAIYPGIAIIVLVLAFNFFGDGVRDALDPKLK